MLNTRKNYVSFYSQYKKASWIKSAPETSKRSVLHTTQSLRTFFCLHPNCVCQKIISTTSIAYPPAFFGVFRSFVSRSRRCAKGSCAKKKLRATFPLYFDGTQNMKKNCVQRRMMSEYINFGVITYHKISYHGKVDRGCSSHVLFSSHSRAKPVTGGAFVVGVKKAKKCRERRNSWDKMLVLWKIWIKWK